jgi:peptide/nickel transport system permease protein
VRHVLPNALAPLIVQGTFVAASAVLTEAILSFLGLGLPADVPTWGNIMAEGRIQFTQHPSNVLFPALFLVPAILAINLLGDGLRDVLDPKFASRTEAQP